MSYDVMIRRVHARPIEPYEILALIDEDPELELFEDDRTDAAPTPPEIVTFGWRPSPSADPIPFLLDREGVIHSVGGTPSNATLRKLSGIAHALDARLFGEEGEELTDAVDGPDVEPTAWTTCLGCLGCSVVGFGPPVLLVVWATRRWLCG